MDDRYWLEAVENDAGLPNGKYFGYWTGYNVTLKAFDAIYTIQVTKFQRTHGVPVTLQVHRNLIDVYLGHLKE